MKALLVTEFKIGIAVCRVVELVMRRVGLGVGVGREDTREDE